MWCFFNGILSVKLDSCTDAALSPSFVTPVVPRQHIFCLDKNVLDRMLRMETFCSCALNSVYTLKQRHWLWGHFCTGFKQSCSLPSNPSSLALSYHTEPLSLHTLDPLRFLCIPPLYTSWHLYPRSNLPPLHNLTDWILAVCCGCLIYLHVYFNVF